MAGSCEEPKPSVDDLVRVLTPTAIEVRPTGEAYSPFPVYDNAAAADVLRRVSKWLDAGAYDVVIGERHRELLDPRPTEPEIEMGCICGIRIPRMI